VSVVKLIGTDTASKKSREWKYVPNADNYGEFMLINARLNFVVLGDRYDAALEDIEAYLCE
jgi:hypothetical protein